MELRDFVRNTLEQIVEGVSAAQATVTSRGATINPAKVRFSKDGKFNASMSAMPQNVEFDVGLTETDKKGATEGIGVFLGGVSLGKRNDVGGETVAVTRVRFTVPVVLPTQEASDGDTEA